MRALILSFMHPDIVPGGAQQVSYNLHVGLQRAGHQSFFTAFHDRLPPRLVSDATPIVKMPRRDNEYIVNVAGFDYEHFISSSRWVLEAYVRFARGIKPDVIFVHHFMLAGIDFLVALRKAFPSACFVFTAHEFLSICRRDGHLVRVNNQLCTSYTPFDCIGCFPNAEPKDFSVRYRMFQKFFDICDVVVTPSMFQGEILAQQFSCGDRLAVIPNGSFDEISHAHNGEGRRPRGETVAFFGQVLRDKGIGFLLQQAPALLTHRKQLRIHIWGSGLELNPPGFRDKVEQAVAHIGEILGRDRIVLRGAYDNRRVVDLMTHYDSVVFPSLWPETFSMVFSEAVVAGCKIVAPSTGAFKERVAEAGGNAYLYRLGDALSFSVAINGALSAAYKPLGDDAGEMLTIDAMAASYVEYATAAMPGLRRPVTEVAEPEPIEAARHLDLFAVETGEDEDEEDLTLIVGDEDFEIDINLTDDRPELVVEAPSPAEPAPARTKPRSWQPASPADVELSTAANPFAEPRDMAEPAAGLSAAASVIRSRKRAPVAEANKLKKRSRVNRP